MTQNIFVKPIAGLIVLDPVTLRPLRPEGEWKPLTNYWVRRLRDNDAVGQLPWWWPETQPQRPIKRFPRQPVKDYSQMTTPLVIVVGADKGGVGKTQTCRALRDYMYTPARKELPRPRLFDGQHPRGDLVNFCPEAEIVNITDIADQMKIFDTLDGVTMVDIPAGQLGSTLQACDAARLLDDVRNGSLRMALLHVLGPSVSSLDEIKDAIAMLGSSAKHFIVKNHINETNFFEWDKDSSHAASLRALAKVTIEIPHLDTVPNEAVQAAQQPFIGFIGGNYSRTQRGHVLQWLEKTWRGFDKVGIGAMIDETFQQ